MARPKEKIDSKRKNFLFDGEVAKMIEEGKSLNGMTETDYVEFAIRSNLASLNPVNKIKELETRKKEFMNKVNDIDKEMEGLTTQLQQYDKWCKIKQQRKPQAIQAIASAMMDGRNIDAENFARNWQKMLGIPAQQLIIEAMAQIKTRKEI